MTTHIVLLRGINVGGRNKVPMAELRASLSRPETGFDNVETYIQSGNILLDAPGVGESEVACTTRRVMADRFGLDIPVVARPADQWPAIIAANPFPQHEDQPSQLHVFFCDQAPSEDALAGFDTGIYAPDQLEAVGRQLYVWYADGAGRSKLTGTVVERRLQVTATARNWSTVIKLAELAD